MLTFNGYIPKRRGVVEHLRSGRLSVMDYVVFDLLLMWADANTGIAETNGPGLVFLSGNQLKLDTVQTSFRNLEQGGYIRRPFYVQGQRGDQKIFIDKFVCTKGKLKGKVLSFAKTTDWRNPVYDDLTEDPIDSHTEDQCDNQPVNQPSNEKLKTENGKEKKVSGSATQEDSLCDDQLSAKEQQPNPRGVAPDPTEASRLETPGTSSPVNSASPRPHSAAPRTDKQVIGDRFLLAEQWRKFIWSVEIPSGTNLSDMEWTEPGRMDMERLLRSTSDSVETIIAAARWGVETSDYWFKPKTKGVMRSFTDFCNAYTTISRHYHNYLATQKTGATA